MTEESRPKSAPGASPAASSKRSTVEFLVQFTAPPIVGLVILIVVFAGIASDDILQSPAVTSTALIVGALLLLVPPITFSVNPQNYSLHQKGIENRARKILQEIEVRKIVQELERGQGTDPSPSADEPTG